MYYCRIFVIYFSPKIFFLEEFIENNIVVLFDDFRIRPEISIVSVGGAIKSTSCQRFSPGKYSYAISESVFFYG